MSSVGRFEARFAQSLQRIAANDPTLTLVNFSGWGIGDDGARRLVAALHRNTVQTNTVVTHLYLANNGISAALVRLLVGVLENSSTLEALVLSRNNFGFEGAVAVARFLRNTSSLVKLYLSNCGITVEGARALAEAHPKISTLTILGLEGNNIGDVGASVLARSFPGNSTLTVIDLDDNGISDAGAVELAEALSINPALITIYLGGNNISDMGTRLLATALLVNSSVTALGLMENDNSEALRQLVNSLAWINMGASSPQEALELKIEWLRNLDEDGLGLLGFEESEVEEEVHRLETVCRIGWLIASGVDGEKEEAVALTLNQLESSPQAGQRRILFQRLLGSPEHGENVAKSVEIATARTLYRYTAECGAAPLVLMNIVRAHGSLCTCRDVKHKLYPFMLLATMPEAGVEDVMEVLKKDPTIVTSGIFQTVTANKRKRESLMR